MKSYLYSVLVVFLGANNCLSQNPSYQIMRDSIGPLIKNDYQKAKSKFISLNKTYKIDPSQKKWFAINSLQNNDLNFFKFTINDLMINHGYKYSRHDMSLKSNESSEKTISKLLKECNLEDWMFQQSDSLYPIWVKQNPRSFEVRKKLIEIDVIDQTMRTGFPEFDSIMWDCVAKKDYINLQTLIQLCDSTGFLPNNFDQGIGGTDWFYLFLHNIKSYQTLEIWEEILPYIERTYLAGKISYDCFEMYDSVLAQFYGYQYYGFLEDVPVKDVEHLIERKKKYGFL